METKLLIIGLYVLSVFAVKAVFNEINKKHKRISLMYLSTTLQTVITIVFLFQFLNQFEAFKSISRTILLSSSLLVAVIGFAFQRSLEDIVAGLMISIYRPFEVGDRINIPEKEISGYIENITTRHTVIRTFQNSRLIIPNSVMNREILENANVVNQISSGFVDFQISRRADVELAEKIIEDAVKNHKESINPDDLSAKPSPSVYINNIDKDYINLRISVWTKTIEENFSACSDIRKIVLKEFNKNNIDPPEYIIRHAKS